MGSTDVTDNGSKNAVPRVSSRRLFMLCTASLVAGIGAATWLEGRGSISYGGSLQSRITSVTAERSARVQDVLFVPGQRVVPGDKLLQLSDDQLISQITEKQRQLVELEADLKMVQAKADVELQWRRRELGTEIFQTQLKVSTIGQERTAKQVEQLAWQDQLKQLKSDGTGPDLVDAVLPARSIVIDAPFADERRLQAILKEDAAAVAAEALSEQLALCEQRLEKLRTLDKQLADKVRISVGVDVVETKIARGREELTALEKQRESLTVVSSSHGIVGTVHHHTGDQVSAGDPLVELLDDERRHLVACIPSHAATKLRPGTRVDLVFPGREPRIGLVSAIPPHAIPADQSRPAEDSQVEVNVEPAGKLWPRLPVGSRVQVRVLQ